MINTAGELLLFLVSETAKLGVSTDASSMLLVGLARAGPCVRIEDNGKAILVRTNYVYFSAAVPIPYGWGPGRTISGHGGGLCFEVIPHITTRATVGEHGCVRGCLGVDPYWGLAGSLIRIGQAEADSFQRWELWGLGYVGFNIPIGYRDTLSGEPKVLPCDVNLFLSAGFTKRFDESQEILPVVMLGLGLNVWLLGLERKPAYQEDQP